MMKTYGLAVVLMMALPMAQAAESPATVAGATTIDAPGQNPVRQGCGVCG